jgi:hypothetical protein
MPGIEDHAVSRLEAAIGPENLVGFDASHFAQEYPRFFPEVA